MMPLNQRDEVLPELEASTFIAAAHRWQLPPEACGPVVCAVTAASKEHLLRQLLASLAVRFFLDPGPWQDLKLAHSPLGAPQVLRDGVPVLSVSFSQAGGRIWGALTGAGRVGVDVALASEFPSGYPLHRVCSQEEFHRTFALVGGASSGTAALLWSLKEAAVKALGVGFNYLSPREVVVSPGIPQQGGYLFEVDAGCLVKTWACHQGQGWLALALLE